MKEKESLNIYTCENKREKSLMERDTYDDDRDGVCEWVVGVDNIVDGIASWTK